MSDEPNATGPAPLTDLLPALERLEVALEEAKSLMQALAPLRDRAPSLAALADAHAEIEAELGRRPLAKRHELLRTLAYDSNRNDIGRRFNTPLGYVDYERVPGLLRELFDDLDDAEQTPPPGPVTAESVAGILGLSPSIVEMDGDSGGATLGHEIRVSQLSRLQQHLGHEVTVSLDRGWLAVEWGGK